MTEEMDPDYIRDAMEYFQDEYDDNEVVFVYVSDDMTWSRSELVKHLIQPNRL